MEFSDNDVTEKIIRCIIKVHQILGPGFLESIYRKALLIELRNQNIKAETEKEIPVFYNSEQVGCHRLDILANDSVIIELKAVDRLCKIHYAQVRSYLKATGLMIGILVNFADEKADFRRIENR